MARVCVSTGGLGDGAKKPRGERGAPGSETVLKFAGRIVLALPPLSRRSAEIGHLASPEGLFLISVSAERDGAI